MNIDEQIKRLIEITDRPSLTTGQLILEVNLLKVQMFLEKQLSELRSGLPLTNPDE